MSTNEPRLFHGRESAAAIRVRPAAQAWLTLVATARAEIKQHAAYVIDPARALTLPVLTYLTWWATYQASGQQQVDGADPAGFLLIGMLGLLTWSSTLWSSGYAIEMRRREGTIDALFLSPASRFAVVLGTGLGSFVWYLPTLAVLAVLGLVTGARFDVANPLVPMAALVILYLGSLCTGAAFAGLFVLSRRANLLANFLQLPVWLLAGFLAPRELLPDSLQPFSAAIPASHAVDGLRAAALTGADFGDVGSSLAAAVAASAGFVLIGAAGLRRVEHAAKRAGTLEFY